MFVKPNQVPLFGYVLLFVYLEDFALKVPFLVLLPVLLVKYDVLFNPGGT